MSGKNLPFTIARVLLGLFVLAFGYHMFVSGHYYYDKYVHAVRKMLLPDSLPSHKPFNLNFTYDQLVGYLIKGDAAIFILSGICILTN